MAKIFWIAEKDGDYMEMFAFNNKRKAQEKALELAPHFSFGDTEIPKEEDDDFGDQWLYSGMINAKECFILYREGGMPYADGEFVDDADASRWVEDEGYDTAGACFPVKLKGGMGSVSMGMEPEGNGTQLFLFTDGEVYETKQTVKTMKYVPTFESFLNEAKVELGNVDSGSMKDKWKIEQVNDQLKGAIGKTCSFLDIISLAGHRTEGVENETSTADTPKSILKKIKCKIVDIDATGSYANLVHQVFFTYDTAPYDGYKYWTKDGVPDLTGNIAKYRQNRAKDENGNFNGAGVKFKDFPSIYPDADPKALKNGGSSLTKGTFNSSDNFIINYPSGSKYDAERIEVFSKFADIFGLGDITPNF